MVSYRSLYRRKLLPRASAEWMQDSGGFNELSLHGGYTTSAADYARRSVLHAQEVGNLAHVAVQDWMCEDMVLHKTGLSVGEHQRRTVRSYVELRELEPELPWMPVLQGQVLDDYRRHVDMYDAAGVDLAGMSLVGLGTVCRRQHTMVAVQLIVSLAQLGLRMHGFGLKVTALKRCRQELASADSMAWSLDGRLPKGGRCQAERDHKRCNNCLDYALVWRRRLVGHFEQRALWEV